MIFFFQIQNPQLLIFCMDGQEFVVNLDLLFYVFFCNIIKFNQFLHCFIILLHLFSFFYILNLCTFRMRIFFIESIECILLSSSALNAILFNFSVNMLSLLLLNLFCVFNINLFFFQNSLWLSFRLSVTTF